MRCIVSVLAAMTIMAALIAISAMPAFAQEADVEVGAAADISTDVSALDLLSLGIGFNIGAGSTISLL